MAEPGENACHEMAEASLSVGERSQQAPAPSFTDEDGMRQQLYPGPEDEIRHQGGRMYQPHQRHRLRGGRKGGGVQPMGADDPTCG